MHAPRGSALPETALVLTATFAMVFGILQIGFIGVLQVMSDGAAFVAAHEYSLGNSQSSSAQFAQRPFPLMGTPFFDANNPDVASSPIPVSYGDQGTGREGGASLILPNHFQATVQIASGGVLGAGIAALSNISLHGSAVEPSFRVSNNAYDIANTGYAGNLPGAEFFSSTENTPAYYVSSHRLLVCNAASFGTTCPTAHQVLLSLGTAEFLDADNWARVTAADHAADNGPGIGDGLNFTFAEVLCHADAFVTAASLFKAATANTKGGAGGMPSTSSMATAAVILQIYSWDRSFANGGSSVETAGQYPLTPYAGC